MNTNQPSPLPSLSVIRKALIKHYNLEELQTLCFNLDLSYDSLTGQGLAGKARELVSYMQRRGSLEQLLTAIRHERGDIL